MKNETIIERENKMKKYLVKFNAQEIVVKDNAQSMFKTCFKLQNKKNLISRYFLNRNYINKTNKNIFVVSMLAQDFRDCLSKARTFYKDNFNKDAKSIEVTLMKATNTSMNSLNNNKLVA